MGWTQISIEEREVVMIRVASGCPVGQIANELGRHRTTIWREIRRNDYRRGYWATASHKRAIKNRRKARRPSRLCYLPLREYVEEKLRLYWSPEQISHRLKLDHPADERMRICHETIYRFILKEDRSYIRYLRQARRRNRYAWRGKKRFKRIRGGKHIKDRPEEVEQRIGPGHWEADSVRGPMCSAAGLATQVDRTSRYLLAAWLSDRKAKTYNAAVVEAFKRSGLPVKTMTVDNGMEFSMFSELEEALEIDVYFARPYHAWERGTNENTNGLLRQFFPKGTDFSGVNPREVEQAVGLLNNRPRKCLGYRTSEEVMKSLLVAIRD